MLTFAQIVEYIPIGSTIELLVLSYTDADHIKAAQQVIRDYNVKKVLWTGFEEKIAVVLKWDLIDVYGIS